MQRIFSIDQFGALGDGETLDTESIRKAVAACSDQGGGVIRIPPGRFLTGSVQLFANQTLRLEAGAVLEASKNLADYSVVPLHHEEFGRVRSLIWAIDAPGIRIEGEGTIEFNGHAFMDVDRVRDPGFPLDRLTDDQFREAAVHDLERPEQPMFFHRCDRFEMESVHLQGAPCWTLTISDSEEVTVLGARIHTGRNFPNADGLHFCSCREVKVSDCFIDTGDDCIAVTGITAPAASTRRVVVENCVLRSSSSAIRIGHLCAKISDVEIRNCLIHDSNRGIAIFAGEGGSVRKVRLTGLSITTRLLAGAWWGKGEPLVVSCDGEDSVIEGVEVSNVFCRSESPVSVVASGGSIRDLSLSDWIICQAGGINKALYPGWVDVAPHGRLPVPTDLFDRAWLVRSGYTDVAVNGVRAMHAQTGLILEEVEVSTKVERT